MILLPRGNPVKEQIDPGKINLPEALGKLRDGRFTGYLRFDAAAGTAIFIFESGKLISALFEGEKIRLTAGEAMTKIFELSLSGGVNLDIFRLSSGLSLSIHALLHGQILYKGQELKLIDIKSLLGRLKEDRISGCLRIYTDEHIALIFYRDGSPLGFFHDGSTDIETTADTSMSVARQPGAKIDVLTSNAAAEAVLDDLLVSADIAAIWAGARDRLRQQQRQRDEEQSRQREAREKERREQCQLQLRAVAERALGKFGPSLIDKEFDRFPAGPLSESLFAVFFDNVTKAAKLVAGPTAVNTMIDEMKRTVRSLFKGN